MTPKEKAQELVDKFVSITLWNGYVTSAKECAYIAVDEILQMVDENMQGWLDADIIAYWKQVKKEIEKL
jgi:hypothetical protein